MAEQCTNEDRFNCKYCSKAGDTCDGAPGDTSGTPPTGPRVCVREEYTEASGVYIGEKEQYPYILKEWEFLYSDGTTETVTSRERVE